MDWLELKASVGIVSALIGGTLASNLGGWDTVLKVLVIMVVLDYVSGLIAAFCEKKLNSEVGFRGVAKKVFIFILVAVAFNVDKALGTELLRTATISFYVGVEGLSVLKNAGRAGLPLPQVLASALEELRKQNQKKGWGN